MTDAVPRHVNGAIALIVAVNFEREIAGGSLWGLLARTMSFAMLASAAQSSIPSSREHGALNDDFRAFYNTGQLRSRSAVADVTLLHSAYI